MLNVIETTGTPLEVEVVRYFKLEGKNYLMYTLNEIDEQNYIKLYALRVNESSRAEKIEDENEWVFVKDQIKVIIKGNKEGNLNIDDQDFSLIQNIPLSETKAFKLSADFVTLLKANKKEFVKEELPVMSFEPAIEPTQEPAQEEVNEVSNELFSFETMPKPEETIEETVVSNFDLPSFEEPVTNTFDLPSFEATATPDLSFDNLGEVSSKEYNFDAPTNEENALNDVFETFTGEVQTEETAREVDFEVEKTEEDYSSIELPKEEIDTDFALDFKSLYEEERALTEVLKSEISELRDKLNKITQVLSQ